MQAPLALTAARCWALYQARSQVDALVQTHQALHLAGVAGCCELLRGCLVCVLPAPHAPGHVRLEFVEAVVPGGTEWLLQLESGGLTHPSQLHPGCWEVLAEGPLLGELLAARGGTCSKAGAAAGGGEPLWQVRAC